MQSYPEAFLTHLWPLMAVAGLSHVSTEASAQPANDSAPASEVAVQKLQSDLKRAFLSRKRSPTSSTSSAFDVWDASRGTTADFHVVLVDKNMHFIPRKAKAQDPAASITSLHSPISPLSPGSPLHPDGIMNPVFIKKHRDMLPCVFVLVLRLWEPTTEAPLTPQSTTQLGDERSKDQELVQEILERKKQTAERGIKLAVVLTVSQELYDSSNSTNGDLDYRLGLLRRASGLDSRGSLFVITSGLPMSQMHAFVTSLKSQLFEAALDYYREHGRRSRRKRGRVGTISMSSARPLTAPSNTSGSSVPAAPLGPQGWTVRYDYKLAVFAEFRQELPVALRHYEDAYSALVDMFAAGASNSNAATSLLPRTKRFNEAKVLADTICLKICKLYLYSDEYARAVSQHNRHMKRFKDMGQTWGLGLDSFEWWSWSTKQYRWFAELVELGLRGGIRLPSTIEKPLPSLPFSSALTNSTVSPSTHLQHPGYYFHLAGLCAIERKKLYEEVAESLDTEGKSEDPAMHELVQSTTWAHEVTVDHDEGVIEPLSHAYQSFKKYKAERTSLVIALQIAAVHMQAGNHELALKFYERIAATYRKEGWALLLDNLAEQIYRCASRTDQLGHLWSSGLRLLASEARDTEGREKIGQRLVENLKSDVTSEGPKDFQVDMSETGHLFKLQVSFDQESAELSSDVQCTVQLTALNSLPSELAAMAFTSLDLHFGDDSADWAIQHSEGASASEEELPIDLKSSEDTSTSPKPSSASLRWGDRSQLIFKRRIRSSHFCTVKLLKAVLKLDNGQHKVALLFPCPSAVATTSSCTISAKPVNITIQTDSDGPAYLDEPFPVKINLTNEHKLPVDVALDALVRSPPDTQDTLLLDGQEPATSLQDVHVGVIQPGQSLDTVLRVQSTSMIGDRSLQLLARCTPQAGEGQESSVIPLQRELSQTVSIPVAYPFTCIFTPRFQRAGQSGNKSASLPSLLDEGSAAQTSDCEVDLLAEFHLTGSKAITVEAMEVHLAHADSALLDSTVEPEDGLLPDVWHTGNMFAASWLLAPGASESEAVSSGTLNIRWRREGQPEAESATTVIPLPGLQPPISEPAVMASYPTVVRLGDPVKMQYTIKNPSRLHVMRVGIEIESSDLWVLSGPRLIQRMTILPGEDKVLRVQAIPHGTTGEILLPRLRVFEHLRAQTIGGEEIDDPGAPTQQREMLVCGEGDSLDAGLEEQRGLSILVIP